MIEIVNLFRQPTTRLFKRNTLCYFFIGNNPISLFRDSSIFRNGFANFWCFRLFL